MSAHIQEKNHFHVTSAEENSPEVTKRKDTRRSISNKKLKENREEIASHHLLHQQQQQHRPVLWHRQVGLYLIITSNKLISNSHNKQHNNNKLVSVQ
jgi:hypothetical protein